MTQRNRFYRALVDRVGQIVEGGGRLSQAFMGFSCIPPTIREMISMSRPRNLGLTSYAQWDSPAASVASCHSERSEAESRNLQRRRGD